MEKVLKLLILLSILFIGIMLAITAVKTARYNPRCEVSEKIKKVEVKEECPVCENDCLACDWIDRPAVK